ncbi:hypothetical protein MLD38_014859 [Melastoma candidum]|uniref:Uncharacterized protein n=1 Tax=Melastoma candidum TaxID=119954 RepID=A0ACB9RDR9_9MYRT|nr:hypothetical protein MLD38_014859 [Melastoma candidum]
MGSYGTGMVDEAEGSEGTIEIKIKTLDSRSYSLRVNKQMPVPALKEQIASLTGVLSDQQRLICRGKVLKDDQLLSAYHVEDGHTLHLVVRQPSDGLHNFAASVPSTASQGHSSHVGPRVVIETLNIPDQGEGLPPEINQIVSAVLGSFGLSGAGISSEGGNERTSSATNLSRMQSEDPSIRGQSGGLAGSFGIPAANNQPPVIPDSLTTMSRFLNLMTSEFASIGRGSENLDEVSQHAGLRDTPPATHSGTVQAGLPTPESLANIFSSTRQFLIQQVAGCLQAFADLLENQGSITDPTVRLNSQHSAIRMGVVLHHLGAFILELGRTVMTLRLGTSTAEAVVNAGPAVFISPTGPNPLMVQPLSFQTGSSLGGVQTFKFEEHQMLEMIEQRTHNHQHKQILLQILVLCLPHLNQVGSDSRGHPLGIYYPVVGRFQPVASSENVFSERPGHPSTEQHLAGGGSGQTSVSNSIPQQYHTVENPERDDAGIASAEPSASEAGTGASDDGIFLSNLLCQIMPYISQHALSGSSNAENVTRGKAEDDSSSLPNAEETEVGTSRRPRDSDSAASSTKRQKTE